MTITIKSEIINHSFISIRQEKGEAGYQTIACPCFKSGNVVYIGNPETNLNYLTFEKAKQRYNYLRRKAQKGEL